MGFTIKGAKRHYHIQLGFDGTKHFAWGWRPSVFDGTVLYRCHPVSLMVWPR